MPLQSFSTQPVQGKYGHSSLTVPMSQQSYISVGKEFILGTENVLQAIGEMDETKDALPESLSPMLAPMARPRPIKLED
jgi:hypothetical protein